jgi:hypothetical protein
MFQRRFLGWQLAALLGACAAAGAQEPARKPDASGNEALLYWQAFGLLSGLPKEERLAAEGGYSWQPSPPEVRREVFQKTAEAAKTIYRATRMARCDWAEDPAEGTAPMLPRVQMCRSLARFLAFRAKHQFEQGQHRAAVDDLLAGFTLARHTAADDTCIGMLVGVAIESVFAATSLEHLQQMDPATLDALQSGLDHIPPRPTWKAILAQDSRRLDEWFIPQFAATSDSEAWKATLRKMYPDAPVSDSASNLPPKSPKGKPDSPKVQQEARPEEPQASVLIERFGTREALVSHLKEGHKLLDELAQFPFPPPGTPSPQLMAKIDEMAKRSPLFRDYCSLSANSYSLYSRGAVRFQLLRAAIAVQRHGREALKDYPDPSGDGPFEYRKRKEGFELVAKLKSHLGPLSVKVGPLAKGEQRMQWN